MFYRTTKGTRTRTHEAPLALLPRWGAPFGRRDLRARDLRPSESLYALFHGIEDRLHAEVADKGTRFEIMLQLLVSKLYDEYTHKQPESVMDWQDYTDNELTDDAVRVSCDALLAKAANHYAKYLPKNKKVAPAFKLGGAMLRGISAPLAPVKILGARRDVIQEFYMYFAKGVYKWDLAQYFTPIEVVDFIVALTNPGAGDQVKDPACGSGDFLISAFHHADLAGANIRDAVFGADNSENAVQVCVLNMVLNDDGKGNIKKQDSLAAHRADEDAFSVMLCNPPFGVRIKERRAEVLAGYDLGRAWKSPAVGLDPTDKVLDSQETGLLFAELCVRQASAGGRIGIILPNGYLGNRSASYLAFREFLLRHTRLAAVVAFPRFTFKKSGADVSASVVVVERRETPLRRASDSEPYRFYAGLVESVGWDLSKKTAQRVYRRDPITGALLTDEANERVVDADFRRVLDDVRRSPAPFTFPWLAGGPFPAAASRSGRATAATGGWSVDIRAVLDHTGLCIDAKRWCERAVTTRDQIKALPHFRIGDVVDVLDELPQERTKDAEHRQAEYQYVEISDIHDGGYQSARLRGWELPSRARHGAARGDLFVGRIWSSVNRWFLAGGNLEAMRVSNGLHRLRVRPGQEALLPDLLIGLNTEAYRIQARSFATGSDGLAELTGDDLQDIVLPRVTDPEARKVMQARIASLLDGRSSVGQLVRGLVSEGRVATSRVRERSSPWVQV